MKVISSEIVADKFTVFHVEEEIPPDTFYVILEGEKHEMFPVYGTDTMTFAIKGEYDITGKDVEFT